MFFIIFAAIICLSIIIINRNKQRREIEPKRNQNYVIQEQQVLNSNSRSTFIEREAEIQEVIRNLEECNIDLKDADSASKASLYNHIASLDSAGRKRLLSEIIRRTPELTEKHKQHYIDEANKLERLKAYQLKQAQIELKQAQLNADAALKKQELAAKRKAAFDLQQKSKDYWLNLDGWSFEKKVGALFREIGCKDVDVTSGSGDGGVDIRMSFVNMRIVVQCKNQKLPVGPGVVRQLFGSLLDEKANAAILVASAGWSKASAEFASGKNIHLIAVEDLIKLKDGTLRFDRMLNL